jgi:hypothetical protein
MTRRFLTCPTEPIRAAGLLVAVVSTSLNPRDAAAQSCDGRSGPPILFELVNASNCAGNLSCFCCSAGSTSRNPASQGDWTVPASDSVRTWVNRGKWSTGQLRGHMSTDILHPLTSATWREASTTSSVRIWVRGPRGSSANVSFALTKGSLAEMTSDGRVMTNARVSATGPGISTFALGTEGVFDNRAFEFREDRLGLITQGSRIVDGVEYSMLPGDFGLEFYSSFISWFDGTRSAAVHSRSDYTIIASIACGVPPVVDVEVPSIAYADHDVTVLVNAYDPDNGVLPAAGIIEYLMSINGADPVIQTSPVFVLPSLAIGTYDVVVTAVDDEGARSTSASSITVRCLADFDGSGGTPDSTDITVFFNAWLAGDSTADADGSGGTPDSTDITTFFTQWLAGGC